MSDVSDHLNDDADALDEVAAAADYLAGLVQGDEDNKTRIQGEAKILRAWADLCRTVADGA